MLNKNSACYISTTLELFIFVYQLFFGMKEGGTYVCGQGDSREVSSRVCLTYILSSILFYSFLFYSLLFSSPLL